MSDDHKVVATLIIAVAAIIISLVVFVNLSASTDNAIKALREVCIYRAE